MAMLREWRVAILLGLATIGSYGVAQYAIGVLISPIARETGWSTASLSAAYAIGVLGGGAGSVLVRRRLDRTGSRAAFLLTLGVGSVLLFASASQRHPLAFALTWGCGSAAIGAGWFYQATMPATARSYAGRRTEAFQVLTLLGAFASPIFYPLTGALVGLLGWRDAVRVLVVLMALLVLPAALTVDARPAAAAEGERKPSIPVRAALREPTVWRAMLTVALVAAASGSLILYQVPVMEAAGLTLAAASGYGGARGFMQAPARLTLTPLMRRLGLAGSLAAAYAAGALGAAALLAALLLGAPGLFATVFAVAGGFAIGMQSPLHGLFAIEVCGEERLGTLSGVQQIVVSVSGAGAPLAVGWMIDASGAYLLPLAAILVVQVLAIAALRWQRAATSSDREVRRRVTAGER